MRPTELDLSVRPERLDDLAPDAWRRPPVWRQGRTVSSLGSVRKADGGRRACDEFEGGFTWSISRGERRAIVMDQMFIWHPSSEVLFLMAATLTFARAGVIRGLQFHEVLVSLAGRQEMTGLSFEVRDM